MLWLRNLALPLFRSRRGHVQIPWPANWTTIRKTEFYRSTGLPGLKAPFKTDNLYSEMYNYVKGPLAQIELITALAIWDSMKWNDIKLRNQLIRQTVEHTENTNWAKGNEDRHGEFLMAFASNQDILDAYCKAYTASTDWSALMAKEETSRAHAIQEKAEYLAKKKKQRDPAKAELEWQSKLKDVRGVGTIAHPKHRDQ